MISYKRNTKWYTRIAEFMVAKGTNQNGTVLDGVPLGQLGIEGINFNDALPFTVLAAVTFTPGLPPTDNNVAGYRPCAYSLDSASMLPRCSHRMRGGE